MQDQIYATLTIERGFRPATDDIPLATSDDQLTELLLTIPPVARGCLAKLLGPELEGISRCGRDDTRSDTSNYRRLDDIYSSYLHNSGRFNVISISKMRGTPIDTLLSELDYILGYLGDRAFDGQSALRRLSSMDFGPLRDKLRERFEVEKGLLSRFMEHSQTKPGLFRANRWESKAQEILRDIRANSWAANLDGYTTEAPENFERFGLKTLQELVRMFEHMLEALDLIEELSEGDVSYFDLRFYRFIISRLQYKLSKEDLHMDLEPPVLG